MADEVRLVDLDVIKRYSLAVRQESASAEELLSALDASRVYVQQVVDDGVAERAASEKAPKRSRPRRPRASRT